MEVAGVVGPFEPMLAKAESEVPPAGAVTYEPKWDGFRTVVFRDGDTLFLASRDQKPLLRYFPELEAPLKAALPERCVVDGEIIVAVDGRLDFFALQQRLHPAASRIRKLAEETPARFVAFDLLASGDEDLRGLGFAARRHRLEQELRPGPSVWLTPATREREVALDWFARFEGAGLDGIVAKGDASTYQAGKRGWSKIKHERTVDAVVAGFRWHKDAPGVEVGSLILALWDAEGRLHQIGVAASFSKKDRAKLASELEPLRDGALDDHPWREWIPDEATRRAGLVSRWNVDKDLSWEMVRLERVVEAAYNHFDQGHLRHPAKMRRWRPDRDVRSCTFDQLDVAPPAELAALLESP
jgi:ATP-dependent DNA ligase